MNKVRCILISLKANIIFGWVFTRILFVGEIVQKLVSETLQTSIQIILELALKLSLQYWVIKNTFVSYLCSYYLLGSDVFVRCHWGITKQTNKEKTESRDYRESASRRHSICLPIPVLPRRWAQ